MVCGWIGGALILVFGGLFLLRVWGMMPSEICLGRLRAFWDLAEITVVA